MINAKLPPIGFAKFGRLAFAGVAACGVALSAPAWASGEGDRDIVISIGEDGELLERLIELDREGIEQLRADLQEARADVADAIADIEEARQEVKGVPGGTIILKVAFASARAEASTAIDEALSEARSEISRAERELAKAEISAEERAETQDAIDVLRTELDALEASLNELLDALRA